MKAEDYRKLLKVQIIAPVYCGGRVLKGGDTISIPFYKFNSHVMVALDKKGNALEKQPEFDQAKADKVLKAEAKAKAEAASKTQFVKKEEDEGEYFDPSSLDESEGETVEEEGEAENTEEVGGADSFA